MTEDRLPKMEAWCKGKGRGHNPGIDYHGLFAIARFKVFEQREAARLELLEKIAKKG